MIPRPPRSTRTDTLFPYTTLFRSARNASVLQRKSDFAAALDRHGDINPHMLARPISPNTLVAGSVIAASLITGLNSDLPGLVTAQVTQNVYDSATGRTLLEIGRAHV